MPFRHRSPPAADDHNGAQWLDIQFLVRPFSGRVRRGKPETEPIPPAWYVVRTCPCHAGERVTIPLPTRQHAERVLELLVHVGVALEGR